MLSATTPWTSRASGASAALLFTASTNRWRADSGSALKSISRALVIAFPLSLTGYSLQGLKPSGFKFRPALVRIRVIQLDSLVIGLLRHANFPVECKPVRVSPVIHLLLGILRILEITSGRF